MSKIRIVDYKYNDGGRSESGFKGNRASDCVVRATAIITQTEYREMYDDYAYINKKTHGKRTARGGMPVDVSSQVLKVLGFERAKAFPTITETYEQYGDCLIFIPRHALAVVNGVVHDTWDSRFKKQGRLKYHSPVERVYVHPDRNPPIPVTNEIDDPTTDAKKIDFVMVIDELHDDGEYREYRRHNIKAFDDAEAKRIATDFLWGLNLNNRNRWQKMPRNQGFFKENDRYMAHLKEAEGGVE